MTFDDLQNDLNDLNEIQPYVSGWMDHLLGVKSTTESLLDTMEQRD